MVSFKGEVSFRRRTHEVLNTLHYFDDISPDGSAGFLTALKKHDGRDETDCITPL
ncbi:hypothetical protein ES703_60072 [subsurface metagenome]